jgi:polygalacturonase
MINAQDYIRNRSSVDDTTSGLQAAIDTAHAAGGDEVFIPAGTWVIRTIHIKSGVFLNLTAGCVLKADTDLSKFPIIETNQSDAHHNKDRQLYHLLVMDHAEHCGLRGEGEIDGSDMAFWNPPAEGKWFYREKEQRISPLLEISDCRYVTLTGITIRNSPGWTCHFNRCDHVRIDGVTLENNLFGPNTDGFDINGCRYVFVSNCRLHCGDDAIILKAMHDARACEYINVQNCIIETNCGALAIGAETHHDIRNVVFNNCTIINSHRMLAVIMWQQGTVENVVFSNITGRCETVYGVDRPIHLDIQEHLKEDPRLGRMRNIQFHNIVCRTSGRMIMTAQDGARIENVTLRDVHIDYTSLEDSRAQCKNPGSTQMSNGSPESRVQLAVVLADNVDNLVLENVTTHWPEKLPDPGLPFHAVYGRNLKGGYINCPLWKPWSSQIPLFKFEGGDIPVHAPRA